MLHEIHGKIETLFQMQNANIELFYSQALKQELVDTRDEHNRDRRELEMTQNELIK